MYTMNDYYYFMQEFGISLAETHCKNLVNQIRNERLLPLDYIGLASYFQTEFKRNPNYDYASSLIWYFLKKEHFFNANPLLSYSKPNVFAEVIQYVQDMSETENNRNIYQLLCNDRPAYINKVRDLCEELVQRFHFLGSPIVASAIISLMTGWCPILHKKFIPFLLRTNNLSKEFLVVIDTFSPLIEMGILIGMVELNYRMIILWQTILFLKKYYDNYHKNDEIIIKMMK